MSDATPTTMPPDPRGFERAPLVAPAQLVRWLEDSDRADGGHREAFFTGRDAEFEMFFRGLRGLAHGRVGGQALVYQGAPGAGKSAMVNEFAAAVEAHSKPGVPWVPVRLSPGTLASPFDAARRLLDATTAEVERLGRGVDEWMHAWRNALDELKARGGGAGGVRVGPGRSPDSAQGVFSAVAPAIARAGARLVVFVDEAQNVPEGAEDVLWCLNGEDTGICLLPVYAGLGNTVEVLQERGMSRPPAERVSLLQPLSDDERMAMLDKALCRAYEAAGTDRKRWLTALADLSHGWPQHLNRVGVEAGRVLRAHDMRMDDDALLREAIAAGTAAKTDYYRLRLGGTSLDDKAILKRFALSLPRGREPGHLHEAKLREIYRGAAELGELGRYGAWRHKMLGSGIIAPAPDSDVMFGVPIPSLADHLRDLDVQPAPQPKAEGGAPPPP